MDPIALLLLVAFAVLWTLAILGHGVDSRIGSTDPRSPARPVGISA